MGRAANSRVIARVQADDLVSLALAAKDPYCAAAVHGLAKGTSRQQLEALMFDKRRSALALARWEHTPASVLEALSQKVVGMSSSGKVDAGVVIRLDKNPSTTASALSQLYAGQRQLQAGGGDTGFTLLIAQHARTPLSVLRSIAGLATDDACLKAVSRNPAADAQVLSVLLKRKFAEPLRAVLYKHVAEHAAASASLLLEAYAMGDVYVRAAVIAHANCPPALVAQAERDEHILLKRKLAASTKVSVDTLYSLAESVDVAVRSAVAANPLAPRRLIRQLQADANHLVRRAVAARQDLTKSSIHALLHDQDSWVRQWIARNANTPQAMLVQLSTDADADVRRAVARNSGCSVKLLKLLADDSSDWVRAAVAYQPKAPKSVLEMLAQDTAVDVLSGVASNSRTPQRILQKLAAHTEADVRRGVILNKQATRKTLLPLLEDPYYLHRLLLVPSTKLKDADKWPLREDPDFQVRFMVFKWMAGRLSA